MSNLITLPDYAYERLERYKSLLGGQWNTFLSALRRPLPVGAWRNTARIGRDAFETWFREVEPAVELEPLSWFESGYRLWTRVMAADGGPPPPGAPYIGPHRSGPPHTEGHELGSAGGGPRGSGSAGGGPRRSGPADEEPHVFGTADGGPHRSPAARRGTPRVPDPRPGNRLARALGLLHLQEEVSMIPALLLDPQPRDRVLDLCGAPGNKTALIASLMQDRGTVLCNDTDRKRLRAGRAAWERLGLSSIAASNHDGGSFPGPSGSWDRVLVDAPCSGEGTSRRVVSALRPGPPGYYRMLHGRQRRLLERALELCRSGGRVVYSTCTYAPEENELVIADVLERSRKALDVTVLPARLPGLAGSSGITEWEGRRLEDELENTLRIWPHQNDSGGFFVAVLEKRSRTAPSAPGVSRGTVPERSNGSGGAAPDGEHCSREVPPRSDMEQDHG